MIQNSNNVDPVVRLFSQLFYSSPVWSCLFSNFWRARPSAVFPHSRFFTLYGLWCVERQTQLENQCDIPLFMLMVLTVSTNHIREELCHCAIIGIMQIVTRQYFVITTLIHKFPFLLLVHSQAWACFFIIYVVFIIFCHHLMLLLLCWLVNRTWKKQVHPIEQWAGKQS